MTAAETNRTIFKEIQAISQAYRARNPIFRHQNAWGLGIMLLSLVMVGGSMWLYLTGSLNVWITILWIAFWTSLLHELEHDLIHYLYFKNQPFMHNFMMLGIWIFRPMTVSPWMRRALHLHHHKYSGSESDLEERAVTNGEKWGLLRLIITPDQILSFVLRAHRLYPEIKRLKEAGKFTKDEVKNLYRIVSMGFLPFGLPLYFAWYAFVLFYMVKGVSAVIGVEIPLLTQAAPYISMVQPFIVLLVAPNLFRQFCLHFITSNLHYYGDVEKGNIVQQTQILNAWWTIPFHIFCFNFGVTHAIHHFFVAEPFYLRQLTAKPVLEILRKYGVRFNDMGTFKRANRWSIQ